MSPLSPRRSRPARRRHALVLALLAAMSALGLRRRRRGRRAGRQPFRGEHATAVADPDLREHDAGASDATPIRITFGDTELTARLHDNATARDLAAQLPLTLTFRDHNNVEKTAPLPRELSLDGAPAGHDPAAGDIGYWAPDGHLVLYYDDAAPYLNGIVRIGEFDGDMAAVKRLPEGARVTIERTG